MEGVLGMPGPKMKNEFTLCCQIINYRYVGDVSWVMLMSNYALVRILVLRFVIPYAGTKVNSHAMKLYPTCGALFGVNYA